MASAPDRWRATPWASWLRAAPRRLTVHHLVYYGEVPIALSPDLDTLGRVGAALGDGTRRGILSRLLDGPAYPADLAEALGASRSNISNHLACLRGCGLVSAVREGRQVRYQLSDRHLARALRTLSRLTLPPDACPDDVEARS